MNPLFAKMLMASGRSWWQAKYKDGKVLSEWDTTVLNLPSLLPIPLLRGKTSRWEEVSKDNMVGMRLLCPNGMCGEIEAPEGHKFFQLKAGGSAIGRGQYCDAHIIGVVANANGDCVCRAWEVAEKRLLEFADNVYAMKYRNIGRLSLDVQGLKI